MASSVEISFRFLWFTQKSRSHRNHRQMDVEITDPGFGSKSCSLLGFIVHYAFKSQDRIMQRVQCRDPWQIVRRIHRLTAILIIEIYNFLKNHVGQQRKWSQMQIQDGIDLRGKFPYKLGVNPTGQTEMPTLSAMTGMVLKVASRRCHKFIINGARVS